MLTWQYSGNPEAFRGYDETGGCAAVILLKQNNDGTEDVVTYVLGQEVDSDSRSDWHDSETIKAKKRFVEELLPHVEMRVQN